MEQSQGEGDLGAQNHARGLSSKVLSGMQRWRIPPPLGKKARRKGENVAAQAKMSAENPGTHLLRNEESFLK
jgi:hypothetical protein